MLNLYVETAFQPDPATQSSVLAIDIPRQNGSYNKAKSSGRASITHPRTEREYSDRCLASASDIYFRQNQIAPRCILWRVIEEKRVLELQPADVTRSESDTEEAHLNLRFRFQDDILSGGVTIVDASTELDSHVFACTTRNEIYHLRIHPAAFRHKEALPQDMGKWAFTVDISSLAIDTVYRIHAHTPYELFVSYTSGMVQRLRRKAEGSQWHPENYDDSPWGASLGRIIGRSKLRSIEHGSTQLDTRAVQGMAVSSDSTYLYTLCLNHQIRVWNLSNGKLAATKDLLGISRESQDRVLLTPTDRGHLQLMKSTHMKHSILVTFSPHEGGQFKFWDVKGGMTEPLSLEDKFPKVKLVPPDPDPSGNTVWSLTGFYAVPGDLGGPGSLWALWRNNNYHQLFTLSFELDKIERSWKDYWVKGVVTSSKRLAAPDLVRSSPGDVTQPWLDFLFTPGRYPATVIETALSMYAHALSLTVPLVANDGHLRSRLCSIIGAATSLRKYDTTALDYDRFAGDTDYQWGSFWRIVENVNDGRNAPLALAFDAFVTQPWVVMAEKCSAVRECSQLELLELNDSVEHDGLEKLCAARWPHRKVIAEERGISYRSIATLINAAANFRKRLPSDLLRDVEAVIDEELFTGAERTTSFRLQEMYDEVNFGGTVSDETFHSLETDLTPLGEIGSLKADIFLATLDLFASNNQTRASSNLRSTVFGRKLLAVGTYEYMIKKRQLLWDLMALIIFMEGELSQENERMDVFEAAELVELIVPPLRLLDRDIWLATALRAVPLSFGPASGSTSDHHPGELRLVSILEDARWRNIEPKPAVGKPQTHLLTETLLEIQEFASGINTVEYDQGTAYCLCNMIVHGEYDLATDFLSFLPVTAWSAYVKGRLYMAKKDYNQAAQALLQATYPLACGKAAGQVTDMSAELISPLEAECFYNGIARYLQHVMALFESAKAYSHAAHFARLVLQSLSPSQREPSDGFRLQILSRLFAAELQVGRYQDAFEALTQFTDVALQKSCASSLIDAILSPQRSAQSISGAVEVLQALPWSLHPVLARQVDQQLSIMAKKQKSVPFSTHAWTAINGDVDFLKLVYAIRVTQHDYRGAVSVLYDRLLLVQKSARTRRDPAATALRHTLLAIINLMKLVSPDEAYILAEAEEPVQVNGVNGQALDDDTEMEADRPRKKRKMIVTLGDLRKEYQHVLDRCSRVERGDFDFEDGGSEASGDLEADRSRLDFSGVLR